MSELSLYELDTQHGELLPEREALGFFTVVVAKQTNVGVNAAAFSAFVAQANVQTNAIVVG